MKITALAGGVGGAKLAHGLAQVLSPDELTIIVNTGDDFEHLGLTICPDLDTVCYTLANFANPETGWGRKDETWNTIANIEKLGGPSWFRLGDSDFATHIERTRRLQEGQTLTQITQDFCKAWGIKHKVLPMSDSPVRTMVDTGEGELAFQEYFVHRRCELRVKGFRFDNVEEAEPTVGVKEAVESADAIVICPSNPWVSIDPIIKTLTASTISAQRPTLSLKRRGRMVIAVSPIIGGKAIKGPAAKMFSELGIEPSALAVAKHYRNILDGFVLDDVDSDLEDEIKKLNMKTWKTNTLMNNVSDRTRLANDVLHFIGSLLT
ncbi:MAG: 2-phospho-L-lactate transferase [Anaerolineales bacterium]|nr:2-phospho-L-lactate transferase [Anaerolineales bacterium]